MRILSISTEAATCRVKWHAPPGVNKYLELLSVHGDIRLILEVPLVGQIWSARDASSSRQPTAPEPSYPTLYR